MRGVIGLSIVNVIVIGIIAVASVWAYDNWIAGKTVFGQQLGRI